MRLQRFSAITFEIVARSLFLYFSIYITPLAWIILHINYTTIIHP